MGEVARVRVGEGGGGERRGERKRWKKTELTRRFGAEHVPCRSTKRPEV